MSKLYSNKFDERDGGYECGAVIFERLMDLNSLPSILSAVRYIYYMAIRSIREFLYCLKDSSHLHYTTAVH